MRRVQLTATERFVAREAVDPTDQIVRVRQVLLERVHHGVEIFAADAVDPQLAAIHLLQLQLDARDRPQHA